MTFCIILQIPKPSHKGFLPWGFVFLACCQVSEQSEEKLPAETRQHPNESADASKVAPCGGMWVQLGREMQTFWFFRGDRSGRSSDVSCPLILQWTLDNYETILINDVLWASAFYFLHFLLFFTYFCNILHYLQIFTIFTFFRHVSDSKTIKQGFPAQLPAFLNQNLKKE